MIKFNVGDGVQVINYGEHAFIQPNCSTCGQEGVWKDHMMHIIGKTGIVSDVVQQNGEYLYAVNGIPEKQRWYKFDQLKQL